mmetsp:Transcript_57069/g.136042  ORF Transcript_57069/g.136042 Transcript_57069/m.136042 type:complete len:201 (+) Transcript_57069:1059-1661(+)
MPAMLQLPFTLPTPRHVAILRPAGSWPCPASGERHHGTSLSSPKKHQVQRVRQCCKHSRLRRWLQRHSLLGLRGRLLCRQQYVRSVSKQRCHARALAHRHICGHYFDSSFSVGLVATAENAGRGKTTRSICAICAQRADQGAGAHPIANMPGVGCSCRACQRRTRRTSAEFNILVGTAVCRGSAIFSCKPEEWPEPTMPL